MSNRVHLFQALKATTFSAAILLAAVFGTSVQAQNVSTVIATNNLFEPSGVAVDSANNLYITDSSDNRIVKFVPTSGILTSLAGKVGFSGTNNGTGVAARFSQPSGIVYTRGGLVVADQANHLLRFVALSGAVTTLAGQYSLNGGFANGAGSTARFCFPTGLAADAAGNVYIADTGNNKIRKLDTNNVVTTLALNFPVGLASFYQPAAVAVGDSGDLWVADKGHHIICRIDSGLNVTLVAGSPSFFSGIDDALDGNPTSAKFNLPSGLIWTGAGSGLLISDTGNHTIRRLHYDSSISDYILETVAGIPATAGYVEGDPTAAKFSNPIGLAIDNVDTGYYVADRANNVIRRLQTTAPLPQVTDPVLGYVTFVPNNSGSLVSLFVPVTQTVFNTAVIIAVKAEGGTFTYITDGPTPTNIFLDTIPAPNDVTGTSVPAYPGDGLPAAGFTSILGPLPDLTIKAVGEATGRRASKVTTARFIFQVGNPGLVGQNAAALGITNVTPDAQMYYTLDGSDPTNFAGGSVYGPVTNGSVLSLNLQSNTVFKIQGFADNFAPSQIVSNTLAIASFAPNRISFGFSGGEASSEFIGAAGQTFYAPITLSLISGQLMYSLQFNVTVTNLTGPAFPPTGASFGFQSMLVKPDIFDPSLLDIIPPAMFVATNYGVATNPVITGYITNLIFTNASENLLGVGWVERLKFKNLYDTTIQDLIQKSLPHDHLFLSANGTVVCGGYSFFIPTNAPIGSTYQIKIGRPSATSDGVAAGVYIQTVTNGSLTNGTINAIKNVTVGARRYIVGDVSDFRWFNAGDFGNTNLDNVDVLQTFQSAVYKINTPTPGSDFFNAMDSSDGNPTMFTLNGNDTVINSVTNWDNSLNVDDVFVTYRRSLDPALTWYARYWSNGIRHVITVPNFTGNFAPASPVSNTNPPAKGSGLYALTVAPDDNIQGAAGATLQIPIRAKIIGNQPVRVMMMGVHVEPLDGSPALTDQVTFTAATDIGSPTMSGGQGSNNFAGVWLNTSATGVSGTNVIGTLTVPLPPGVTANSAYVVHFDHFSASPNGVSLFPTTTQDSLITVGSRTNSSWNDGISDAWRLRNFGTVSNLLSAANVDADGDGMSNWAEFRAGTNPQDTNSVLRMNGSKDFTLQWPTTSGTFYMIECSSSLVSTNWSVITSNVLGDGSVKQFVEPNRSANARFYRVRVQ